MSSWAIAFNDGDKRHFFKNEILDERGNFLAYAEVCLFDSYIEARQFMLENVDSRAYDFYIMELTSQEVKEVEDE